MIDFDTVELSNFGPFKEARYSLDNKGLVQVKGVNKSDKGSDSNGAGKSSLLEAIVWCLFGKTAKGLNKTDVIRKGSSVCEVRVRFTKGDERFFLFRKRGKEEKVFIAATKDKDEDSRHATWVDMTLGTLALNQKLIEKIIGCDYEVFCESVYIGQENLPNIPAMTDRQIKDLLENASGITELDKAYQIVKRGAKDISTTLDGKVERSSYLRSNVTSMAATIETIMESEKEQRENYLHEIDILTKETKESENSISEFESVEELEKKIAAVKMPVMPEGLEKKSGALAYEKNTIELTVKKLKTKLASLVDEKGEAYLKIGSDCFCCGGKITEDNIPHILGDLEKNIEETMKKITICESKLEDTLKDIIRIDAELEHTKESLKDDMKSAKKLIDDLTNKIHQIKYVKEKSEVNKYRIKTIGERIIQIESEDSVKGLKLDLARFEIELADLETIIKKLTEDLENFKKAEEVLSPTGVRVDILDKITPVLNALTTSYLSVMTEDIKVEWSTLSKNTKGEVKEKFSVNVEHSKGYRNFALLSGGERRRVRLACAFAIQDIVAMRQENPINLFIADEIDSALDSTGTDRLLEVLEMKAEKRKTAVVISHTDLSGIVPNSINVVKKTVDGETFAEIES